MESIVSIEGTQFDNRRNIAEGLSQLGRGSIIPTEAGFLPYYSGWTTYDPWGLNTAEFAKRLFMPSDVENLRPDIIEAHAGGCVPQTDWQTPYTQRTWEHMTRNLIVGADRKDYDLWYVPFGNERRRLRRHIQPWQGEQECWFVRRDSPLHSKIESLLAQHSGETASEYNARNPLATVDVPSSADPSRSIFKRTLMAVYNCWVALSW